MPKLRNLARMTVAVGGTGTLTLGSAAPGFVTFPASGFVSGDVISYGIEDGSAREVGRGTFSTANGVYTLSRDKVLMSTLGGAHIDVTTSARVYGTILAEDMRVSALQDVDQAVSLADGMFLQYQVSVPTAVQMHAYGDANNDPVMSLASAPSVGNTVVIIVSGYVSASCAGFDVVASRSADGVYCTVLKRLVASGDGTTYNVTTGVMSYLCTGLIMEVAGKSFELELAQFLPSLSGNTYSQTFTVDPDTLNFAFYSFGIGGFQTCTATGADILGQVSWFVASCASVQVTTSGTVALTYTNASPSPVAFSVVFRPVAKWVPITLDELKTLINGSGGGGQTGTMYIKLQLDGGYGTDVINSISNVSFLGSSGASHTPTSVTLLGNSPSTSGGKLYLCAMGETFTPVSLAGISIDRAAGGSGTTYVQASYAATSDGTYTYVGEVTITSSTSFPQTFVIPSPGGVGGG